MREIKFRGKDYLCNWHYGSLIKEEYIEPNWKDLANPKSQTYYAIRFRDENDWTSQYKIIEVMPHTLGQYIGLKDKNDKEIFEGDIVKDILGQIGQIVYKEKYSAFVVDKWEVGYALWFDKGIEVIGNIYDNPELLGE